VAAEVGAAFVSIVPSLKGFSSKLKSELRGELRTIDPVVGEAGHRAGQTFGSRMHSALSPAIGRIGQLLKTGLVVGTAAAVAGLGAMTLFGLKAAAALEQTTIGIEALLGSAQEAKKFIGELQAFAAKTPFEFAGVADASRRILAFGTSVGIAREQVIPTLTTIGDLISVLGGTQENIDSVIRAFGQMASKGKVSQEEVLQLAEALPGFNVNAAIAAKLGLSVADTLALITAGGVDARTGINAILEGMAQFPGAAGAMAKQAETLKGVFSTFKDTISIALTNAFEPVIPSIKDALKDLTPVLGEAIGQLAPKLGMLLQAFLPIIGVLSQVMTPILVPILAALSEIIPILQPALQALGKAFASIITALVPMLIPLAKFVAALAEGLAPVIEAIAPQIADLAKPIGDLLIALIPLIPPLAQLLVLFLQMQAPLIKLISLALSFLAVEGIAPAVAATASAMQKLLDKIQPLVDFITDLSNWPAIFDNIKTNVGTALSGIGAFFAALPGQIGAFLLSLPAMLGDLARQALNNMAFAVGFGIGRIIRFFIELPGNVVAAVTALWTMVKGLFTKGVDDTKNNAVSGFNQFVDFVKGLPGRVIGALSSLPGQLAAFAAGLVTRMFNLGRDIVQGAINGIKSMIGNLIGTLSGGFSSAINGVKHGLGIASPSKVFATIGEDTIAGYVKGVEQSAKSAASATMSALGPSAASSPAAASAAAPKTVNVTSSDPVINAVMGRIREVVQSQFGGDVDFAFGPGG